jgi:ATP-dependent RNA helicase RhlE
LPSTLYFGKLDVAFNHFPVKLRSGCVGATLVAPFPVSFEPHLRDNCAMTHTEPLIPALGADADSLVAARFDSLPLDAKLLQAIEDSGYLLMTPIQAKAIPIVLEGKDVMGAAQTGTGKTAAFSVPLLQKLMARENISASPARHPVRALILAPTRELADQVAKSIQTYSRHTKLRSIVVFGGVDMKPQMAALKSGVEVLIATPGRLLDHLEAKSCSLSQVEYVVLDEADRMLDIGFLPDLQRILSFLPAQRQTLLFSATFSPEIKRLAESYLRDPVLVEVARPNATATTVEQIFIEVSTDQKQAALVQLLLERQIKQAIVFVNSKLGCARLTRTLERAGLKANALHGDKSQDERLKALQSFKNGEVDLLVATDVAARGLDIVDLPAVFNFDVPFNAEDYVHRIGRTGRAGATGIAITFVTESDRRLIGDIQTLIKKKIEYVAGSFAPAASVLPRARRPEESRDSRPVPARSTRSPGPSFRKPTDSLFDQPYVPQEANAIPSWDTATVTKVNGRSLSPNIKPKRKVAALLSSKKTS